jgi:hypothetical protein
MAGGTIGSWCCRLRLARGAGRDGLEVASSPSPAGPAASLLDAACVRRAAAAAFVVSAAALGAAAAGAAAAVALEAATAA